MGMGTCEAERVVLGSIDKGVGKEKKAKGGDEGG
jgi:hypothetical protein